MRITKRTDHFRPPLIALHQKLSILTLVIVRVIQAQLLIYRARLQPISTTKTTTMSYHYWMLQVIDVSLSHPARLFDFLASSITSIRDAVECAAAARFFTTEREDPTSRHCLRRRRRRRNIYDFILGMMRRAARFACCM